MRALTVCQPYAELIARGEKLIENRTWATAYRGPLAIHAGKSRAWMDSEDMARYPGMSFGAVVAVVQLVECVHLRDLPAGYLGDSRYADHANGPWCWVLGDVRRLPAPIPARGAQGFWEWQVARD